MSATQYFKPFLLLQIPLAAVIKKTIVFQVWGKDFMQDEQVGEVTFPLSSSIS